MGRVLAGDGGVIPGGVLARSDGHGPSRSLGPGRTTIVAIKACTEEGYCFADSVAAALQSAGDWQIDIVDLSLVADPYLYYLNSEKEQKAILRELEAAARYAQQRGVLVVAATGNEQADLQHPF